MRTELGKHIKRARAPRARGRSQRRAATVRVPAVERIDAPQPAWVPTGPDTALRYYTQRVSGGDIRRGIIRIPRPVKTLFPGERASVEIDLRGERKSCRWDPRYGPDQARSGVLGIGTTLTRRLVTEGERLAIQVQDGVFFLE